MLRRSALAGWVLVAALLLPAAALGHPSSVGYTLRWVASTKAHVVTVNLNDPDVKVAAVIAAGGLGRSETFRSIVNRSRPDAAITGTYFGTRCLIPVGDLVVDGTFVHLGRAGSGLAITRDNRAEIIPRQQGRLNGWSDYETVICGGPTLVRGGKVVLDPRAEGFTSGAHFRTASRTAVGITAWNKLLLVSVAKPIHLGRMAKAMKALGAKEAISLDGGSSTALAYGQKVIVSPARRLTHVLAIYASRTRYEQVMGLKSQTAG